MISVIFESFDGTKQTKCTAKIGETLLDLAQNNDIDIEGACEGNMACSTCHVIIPKEFYDRLPVPSEEEDEMLDLAFGLTGTSRLGCQILVTPEMDGLVIRLPRGSRNMMGF